MRLVCLMMDQGHSVYTVYYGVYNGTHQVTLHPTPYILHPKL